MAETLKKKYIYDNRISATVKPGNLKKVKDQVYATGDSASSIVDQALTDYFERQKAVRLSKHAY